MKQEILRLEGVTYKKENHMIFRNLTLNIFAGEVMGLLPSSAYGLDELLEIITENPSLYYGYVYYQEHCVNSWKDPSHLKNRICVIDSETSLVNGLNVVTNVFALRAGFRQEIINEHMLAKQLQPFLEEIHVSIHLYVLVENLTPYERVIVELLRAVVAGYRLIIMREISTVISENEMEELYKIIRYYAEKGFSFFYISFHFEEIQQVCTRAALMTEGTIELIMEEKEIQEGLNLMYYQDYYNHVSYRMRHRVRGSQIEVLKVRPLCGDYPEEFGFSVYQGECLVVQCLETKLYREIREGMEGELWYKSRQILFLKEEPAKTMLFEDLSVKDNLCLALDGKMPSIWLRKKVQKTVREEYRRTFGEDIFYKGVKDLTDTQKINLVYMRILLEKPKVVFMLQPFKNADISHRLQIWELQAKLLEKGIAIVILAMNMSDSLAIADRLIRIGRINGKLVEKEYTQEQFAKLPVYLPWVELLDEMKEGRKSDGGNSGN